MAGTFTKHGLVYEDHHMKNKDGAYEMSPPSGLEKLYSYLPNTQRDDEQGSHKIPQKIVLRASLACLNRRLVRAAVPCHF